MRTGRESPVCQPPTRRETRLFIRVNDFPRNIHCGFSRRQLPGEVPEHRNPFAVSGDAVDSQLGRADHEVDVLGALVAALTVLVLEEKREAVAERNMARCVLVEQGVVENNVERADSPLAVDERQLTEPARTLVDLGEA